MYSGIQGTSITPGGGAAAVAGVAVVALPSTGVGPLQTLSLLTHTLAISALLACAAILAVVAIRLYMQARMRGASSDS
jgi:hypothetical protein